MIERIILIDKISFPLQFATQGFKNKTTIFRANSDGSPQPPEEIENSLWTGVMFAPVGFAVGAILWPFLEIGELFSGQTLEFASPSDGEMSSAKTQ